MANERASIAVAPEGVTIRNFIGAACLCGVGDTVALLMADQAFPQGPESAVAKIGVLIGSTVAAAIGAAVLATGAQTQSISAYEPGSARSEA